MIPAILLAALVTLPVHVQLHPVAAPPPVGGVTFAGLREPVRTTVSAGTTTFAVNLAAADIGGVPRDLHVRIALQRPAADVGPALLQVSFNGALIGARELRRPGAAEAVDIAIPAAFVGSDNEARITISTRTAALLPSSSFAWSGVRDQPTTVADFFKVAHGRAIVLIDPAFAPIATSLVRALSSMNPAVASVDIDRFTGVVPAGYDEALVIAPPAELAQHFALPLHGGATPFRIVNPLNETVLVDERSSGSSATLQVGRASGAPLLAVSYVGDAHAIERVGRLTPADLIVQVANISLLTPASITAYDVGSKLRVTSADDDRLAHVWSIVRLPLALALLAAILAGGLAASRRLAQKPAASA